MLLGHDQWGGEVWEQGYDNYDVQPWVQPGQQQQQPIYQQQMQPGTAMPAHPGGFNGFTDNRGVYHTPLIPQQPMQGQQAALTPSQAQQAVAAHVASQQQQQQQQNQGMLVHGNPLMQGQPRLGTSQTTNPRTGDPKFEFDPTAQEFVKKQF